MKFSLITPTHRPNYIQELYDSIKAQTHTDWEWILYLNGFIKPSDLPDEIVNDPQVKIHVDKKCELSPNVGYQKNKAFHLGIDYEQINIYKYVFYLETICAVIEYKKSGSKFTPYDIYFTMKNTDDSISEIIIRSINEFLSVLK